MPELPEVERARRLIDRVATGRRIASVEVAEDPIVVHGTTPEAVRSALEGRVVTGTGRHGKHLWIELESRPWPLFHLGMTGAFESPGVESLQLASGGNGNGRSSHSKTARSAETSPPAKDWPPRFTKVALGLAPGRGREAREELAFTNARRLGRVRLVDDPRREPPIDALGFDPLLDMPEIEEFSSQLRRRTRARLKSLLLDQKFCAGIGNWIADEVLYHAELSPHRKASSLGDAEVESLHRAVQYVITAACATDANADRFPKSWLFGLRWGRRGDEERRIGGALIRFEDISGRRTVWVPSKQR